MRVSGKLQSVIIINCVRVISIYSPDEHNYYRENVLSLRFASLQEAFNCSILLIEIIIFVVFYTIPNN